MKKDEDIQNVEACMGMCRLSPFISMCTGCDATISEVFFQRANREIANAMYKKNAPSHTSPAVKGISKAGSFWSRMHAAFT